MNPFIKVTKNKVNRYKLNHLKLHFLMILIINFMAIRPVTNDAMMPKIVATIFILEKSTDTASNTVEPKIIGILIRKTKSATFFLSVPASIIPPEIVDPLRLIPGKIAMAWLNPIIKADLYVMFGLGLILRPIYSVISKIIAVRRKPNDTYLLLENMVSTVL